MLRSSFTSVIPLTLALLTVPHRALAQNPDEPSAGEVELMDYQTQEGDTCKSIAKRFFGDSRRWDVLHRYNPQLSERPLPHRFAAGEVLRIPSSDPSLGPDAQITAAQEEVRARPAQDDGWNLAQVGLNLYRGWRVNTLARSFAEVTFRDTTQVELRENTLVIIYGGTRTQARRAKSEAVLERGALRARLGELSGDLAVETPSSSTQLEQGKALVTVDETETTRVANHGGKAARVRGKRKGKASGKGVEVAAGFGSKVERGKDPSPPRPLPPAPGWSQTAPITFLALPDRPATVEGSWSPVGDAAAYRVELARSLEGRDVVASVRVPSTTSNYRVQALPAGDYYARLSSIDGEEFEGVPGDPAVVRVREAQLVLPGGVEPGGEPDGPIEVLPGTRLELPPGASCAADGTDLGDGIVFPIEAGVSVQCTDAGGDVLVLPTIATVPVAVAGEAGANAFELRAGETTTLPLTLHASLELPGRLPVHAPEGWVVGELVRLPDGTWTLEVTVPADAVPEETGDIEIRLGEGDEAVTIAVLSVTPIVDEPEPEPAGPELHMGEIGVYGGLLFPSTRHELFDFPDSEFQRFAITSPDFGLRAAYHPIRWVGAEIDAGISPTRTRGGQGALLYSFRGGVVGQLHYAITPFVTLGGGLMGVSSAQGAVGRDFDAGLYFGGGVKYYALRRLALLLDIRDTVLPARGDGPDAHHAEVLFGVSFVLGRTTADRSGARLRTATSEDGTQP